MRSMALSIPYIRRKSIDERKIRRWSMPFVLEIIGRESKRSRK